MAEVLPLENYEAAYSIMSIVSAFFIVAMVIGTCFLLYSLIKQRGKKRIFVSLFLVCFIASFGIGVYMLRLDMISVVKDIIEYYPDAGYFL